MLASLARKLYGKYWEKRAKNYEGDLLKTIAWRAKMGHKSMLIIGEEELRLYTPEVGNKLVSLGYMIQTTIRDGSVRYHEIFWVY